MCPAQTSAHVSTHKSAHVSAYLCQGVHVHVSLHLSIAMPIHMSTSMCMHMSIHKCIHMSIQTSIHMSTHLSISISLRMSTHMWHSRVCEHARVCRVHPLARRHQAVVQLRVGRLSWCGLPVHRMARIMFRRAAVLQHGWLHSSIECLPLPGSAARPLALSQMHM